MQRLVSMHRTKHAVGKKTLILALLSLLLSLAWAKAQPPKSKPSLGSGPDLDVKDFRLKDLKARLSKMPPGAESDYFTGIVANAEGHIVESSQLLTSVLPSLRTSRPDRAAVALRTLADSYIKGFRYGDAWQAEQEILAHYSSQLTAEQLKGTKDDSGLMQILRDAPPQTIAWTNPPVLKLKTERNPINSLNVQLTVNGVQGPWLLDTGANFSLVTKSFAQRLGLKPLPGVAYVQAGLTGIENPLQVALLPTLRMGSATLHNVVTMILEDASLNIGSGKQSYQINGIVGYPVFQALGAIKLLHQGEFEGGPSVQPDGQGTTMYMRGPLPIIEATVAGKDLPFSFDTGASGTDLLVRYYREFRSESGSWKKTKWDDVGAGGIRKRKIYVQPEFRLSIGGKSVILKQVPIFTTGTGTDTDGLYGNLGQDVPADFSSFTLDLAHMTFSLGTPLLGPPPAGDEGKHVSDDTRDRNDRDDLNSRTYGAGQAQPWGFESRAG